MTTILNVWIRKLISVYTTGDSGKSAENLKEMLLIMLCKNHIYTVFQLTSLREMLHPSLRNPKLIVTVNCIQKAVYLATLRTTPWVSVMTGIGKWSFFACKKLPNWKFSQKEKHVPNTHLPSLDRLCDKGTVAYQQNRNCLLGTSEWTWKCLPMCNEDTVLLELS